MEFEEILNTIKLICISMGKPCEIEEDTDISEVSLRDDLKLDDIDLVELRFALQEEFETEIADDDIEECDTLENLCEFLLNVLNS